MKHIILALLLTACGTEEQTKAILEAASATTTEKTLTGRAVDPISAEDAKNNWGSLYLQAHGDLPFCDESKDGVLAYIVDEKAFYSCSSIGWTSVEIKGKDGEKGEQGQQGIAGTDGAQGIQGLPGLPGASSNSFPVYAGAKRVGTYVGFSSNDTIVDVVTPMGLRVSLSTATGAVQPTNALYFSGPNCTGNVKMTSLVGFQNVALDTRDNYTLYKYMGLNQSLFSYVSKTSASGCVNSVGQLQSSWSVQPVSEPFVFPINSPVSLAP